MPGVSVDQVVQETAFELLIPSTIAQEKEPTAEELRILREEVDPWRVMLGRGGS